MRFADRAVFRVGETRQTGRGRRGTSGTVRGSDTIDSTTSAMGRSPVAATGRSPVDGMRGKHTMVQRLSIVFLLSLIHI